jgi:hypothetical protein
LEGILVTRNLNSRIQPAESTDIPFTDSDSTLKISLYDNISNWLIALLLLSSIITGCLVVIWFGSRMRYDPPTYLLKVPAKDGFGRGNHSAGFAWDAKGPGDPDLPAMDEPAGSEVFQLSEAEPIAATHFVNSAMLAVAEVGDIDMNSLAARASGPGFHGHRGGPGEFGDRRPPGPPGDGVATIPREERWEFRFASNSRKTYAQQLDFFKIELGVIGGKREIDYAFNVSQSKPDTKIGPSTTESRLYMTWKSGTLREFDRSIIEEAGISTSGRLIVQFFPKEIEDVLFALEVKNSGNRSPKEFLKTIFGVRPASTGFEFFVVEQRFRPAPR